MRYGELMTNGQVRAWCNRQIESIAARDSVLAEEEDSLEVRARLAFEARRQARIAARSRMQLKEEVKLLEAPDRAVYGRPEGPSFEDLVERHHADGLPTD